MKKIFHRKLIRDKITQKPFLVWPLQEAER